MTAKQRRARLLPALIAGASLLAIAACSNFRTECLEKDAFCDGLSAWLAYQSVTPIILVGDSVGQIHISYDGYQWRGTAVSGGLAIKDVTFANGRFWAVANTGIGQGRVYFSEDGLSWQSTTSGISPASPMSGILFGNGLYIATCELPAPVVYTSSDGINWTANNDAGLAGIDFAGTEVPAFAGGRFLAGDAIGGVMLLSNDGRSWSNAVPGITQPLGFGTLNGTSFWADGGSLYTTTTLPGPLPPTVAGITGIRAGSANERTDVNLAVIAGTNAVIHISNDGANWSANLSPGGTTLLSTVSVEDPRYMLAGGLGGVYYLSTSRGATWQGPFTIPGAGDLRASVTRPGFPFQ